MPETFIGETVNLCWAVGEVITAFSFGGGAGTVPVKLTERCSGGGLWALELTVKNASVKPTTRHTIASGRYEVCSWGLRRPLCSWRLNLKWPKVYILPIITLKVSLNYS